jgi:Glycosyltransferase like family 2
MSAGIAYLLPIRAREGDAAPADLPDYLAWLAGRADVVVVDGSDAAAFSAHRAAWPTDRIRHVRPADDIRSINGKVRGVLTGLRLVEHDRVVVADDDVRYDDPGLRRIGTLLNEAELVRPQNYFDPLPWHARWDTARTLVNRSVGHDYPGTLGVRRSFLEAIGGYDGDVLFENLELIRTVRAAGGRVVEAPDLFVRRVPPTLRRFVEQRPRQAYDDWAQPARFAAALAVGPLIAIAAIRRPRLLAIGAGASVAVAWVGRMRHHGASVFDRTSTFFAPLWIAERAVLSWVALGRRIRGGVPYAGGVIERSATPPRVLRRRLRPRSAD